MADGCWRRGWRGGGGWRQVAGGWRQEAGGWREVTARWLEAGLVAAGGQVAGGGDWKRLEAGTGGKWLEADS